MADRIGFCQDILTTAVETAYSWFDFHKVERMPDLTICRIVVGLADGYDGSDYQNHKIGEKHTIEWDHINDVFERLQSGPMMWLAESIRARYIGASAIMDAGEFDAVDADSILQLAVLGEIVFG